MMLARLFFGCVLAAFVFSSAAWGHEARPLYIDIAEQPTTADGMHAYRIAWKTPPNVPAFNQPKVQAPDLCREQGRHWMCDAALDGQAITIAWPKFNPSVSTMLRVSFDSGEQRTILASPDTDVLTIPTRETASSVAGQYGLLGMEHIFAGYDHLLFLVCLLFIAGTGRRILIVITGFTLAHSITLGAAALGLVRVPVPPVEAIIALSVVFLATEIAKAARDESRRDTLTWRHPIAVSSSFGLLHGFGFASVLADIGLPQTELVTALLAFNVGIEVGQIIFVLVIITLARLVARLAGRSTETAFNRSALPAAYGVGIIASYWLVDRVAGFM